MKKVNCTACPKGTYPFPKQNGYVLDEPYCYNGKDWAPAGFFFNGANIPWLVQPITFAPNHPMVQGPAAGHDFAFMVQGVSRSRANRDIRDALLRNGAPKIKARLVYWGLKLGSWTHWKKAPKPEEVRHIVECLDDQRNVGMPLSTFKIGNKFKKAMVLYRHKHKLFLSPLKNQRIKK